MIGYGRDYNGKPIDGDKTAQSGLEQCRTDFERLWVKERHFLGA